MSESKAISQAEIVHELEIEASADRVFTALTRDVASWWSHVTYETSGKPDLRLEPHAGGRFFERHDGNERLYALVTRCEPAAVLTMQGGMGMSGCTVGTIAFSLEAKAENTTVLKLQHTIIGQVDPDVVNTYRGGWRSLLNGGLKPFVEEGKKAWSAA